MATEKKFLHTDLINKSYKQLLTLRNELRKELFETKLALSVRKLNQTHLITFARKNIARVNTALKTKTLA
jgi:ribosomal protein L29